MIGILETCRCGRKFLRGIYPQKKCETCDVWNDDYWGKYDADPKVKKTLQMQIIIANTINASGGGFGHE